MNIKWAFNSATIMNCGWDEELALWQEFGWRAAEIWDSKLQAKLDSGATYSQLARQMQDAGVLAVGLCAGMISTRVANCDWQREKETLSRLLDTANAMGAPSLTVVIIGEGGDDLASEYSALADKLREVAELGVARQLLINLEFLGGLPVNGTLGSCIELVNQVNHSNLGMLFDFCHYYASASHLEELPLLQPNKIFMVHVDDAQRVPMERLSNEARCFPGEGRIDVAAMIRHFRDVQNYDGYFSVELYDKGIWAMEPREVMTKLAASLRVVESRL